METTRRGLDPHRPSLTIASEPAQPRATPLVRRGRVVIILRRGTSPAVADGVAPSRVDVDSGGTHRSEDFGGSPGTADGCLFLLCGLSVSHKVLLM